MTAPDYSDLDRIGYQVHPVAARFDPYTDAELDALAESIKHNGVLNPITLTQDDGRIVDGVHRARAVAHLRAHGEKVFLPARRLPDHADPYEYARANNDIRRHRPTVLEAARMTTTDNTGGRPETSENSEVMTRKQAAEKAGVSPDTITHARKVVEKSPEPVQDAVEAGAVSVSDAAAVADLPHEAQTDALAKVEAGEARTLKQAAAPVAEPEPAPEPPVDPTAARKEWETAAAALERYEKDEWHPVWEAHHRRVAESPAGKELHDARTERNRLQRELEDAETRVTVAKAAVEDWVEEHALDEYQRLQELKAEVLKLRARADDKMKAWKHARS